MQKREATTVGRCCFVPFSGSLLAVFRFGGGGPRTFNLERSRFGFAHERSTLNVRALRAAAKVHIFNVRKSVRTAVSMAIVIDRSALRSPNF